MKKVSIVLICFWISILLMVIISSVFPQDPIKENSVKQDSIKKSVKLTDLERKKLEYLEWQKRSQQIDKSMEKLEKQSMMMDSLLGKSDTTKIK